MDRLHGTDRRRNRPGRLAEFFRPSVLNAGGAREPVFGWVIVVALAAAATAWALFSSLSLPTVYQSWSTKKCERVVYGDGSLGNCSRLPAAYNHIWTR